MCTLCVNVFVANLSFEHLIRERALISSFLFFHSHNIAMYFIYILHDVKVKRNVHKALLMQRIKFTMKWIIADSMIDQTIWLGLFAQMIQQFNFGF